MQKDSESHLPQDVAPLGPALGKVMVVSPHLGYAAFSCGDLLAVNPGAVVVTVFAGDPQGTQPLTDWDRTCGFGSAGEAITVRKDEDQLALFLLDAQPVWLPFVDPQYGPRPGVSEIAAALARAIERHAPASILLPLGLFLADHADASDAALELCASCNERQWIAYADALYRSMPDLASARIAELEARGWRLQPVAGPAPTPNKRHAAACYSSQLEALRRTGHVDVESLCAPEQYWHVVRAR